MQYPPSDPNSTEQKHNIYYNIRRECAVVVPLEGEALIDTLGNLRASISEKGLNCGGHILGNYVDENKGYGILTPHV